MQFKYQGGLGDESRPINSCIRITKADQRIGALVTFPLGLKSKNRSSVGVAYSRMFVGDIGAFFPLLSISIWLLAFVIMCKVGAL